MATSPPTSNTLHLLQPKPSVPRSIHLISDFDNTITRTDTIQTVISHSTHLNFPTIWKGLVSAYIQDYTSSIRNDDERGKCREIVRKNDDTNTTIPEYESMQERLREVELRSIERVETSGLLGKNVWRDINCGDVEEGNNLVKDVEMLDNEGWWEVCKSQMYDFDTFHCKIPITSSFHYSVSKTTGCAIVCLCNMSPLFTSVRFHNVHSMESRGNVPSNSLDFQL